MPSKSGFPMAELYETSLLLGSEHVDLHRRLRTSALFSLLQQASIRHTEELGMGREKTLDKGLLWVVTRQYVKIRRMPEYDERVTVRSWPGETMRVLFPRFYEILSETGETLVQASALWTLMDIRDRGFVFPEEHGIEIAGIETGREISYLEKIRPLPTDRQFTFDVPYSYIDLNGHMNNTRYFDLAEDHIDASIAGRQLREIRMEYANEVRYGRTLTVDWGVDGSTYYLCGTQEKPCFKMLLQYEL